MILRFIRKEDDVIVAIRTGKSKVDGEIESEFGEIGQRLVDDTWKYDEEYLKLKEYHRERAIAISELNNIKDGILLGENTEDDLLVRQKEWSELKKANDWNY